MVTILAAYNHALSILPDDLVEEWVREYPRESKSTLAMLQVCASVVAPDGDMGDVGRWVVDTMDVDYSGSMVYEDVLAAVNDNLRKDTGSWYTPDTVADSMTRLALEALGRKPDRAVDMASGQGAFGMAAHRAGVSIESWELQAVPALVYQILVYRETGEEANVVVKNALEELPARDADLVIGNPPYSKNTAPTSGAVARLTRGVKSNLFLQFHVLAGYMSLDNDGVVCMIHPNVPMVGKVNAPWRRWCRSKAKTIWVINVSPEGDLCSARNRIFPTVRSPLCITILSATDGPGGTWYTEVHGTKEEKERQLRELTLTSESWERASDDLDGDFTTKSRWEEMPLLNGDVLANLKPKDGDLVSRSRVWALHPNPETLRKRAELIVNSENKGESCDFSPEQAAEIIPGLGSLNDMDSWDGDLSAVWARIGDRQYVISDPRVSGPGRTRDDGVVVVSNNNNLPKSGGLVAAATGTIDKAFLGSGSIAFHALEATRVVADNARRSYGADARQVAVYALGVAGLGGYTRMFAKELVFPGLRIPFPVDPDLFWAMQDVGERLLDIHLHGAGGGESKLVQNPSDGKFRQAHYDEVAGVLRFGDGILRTPQGVVEYTINAKRLIYSFLVARSAMPTGGFPRDNAVSRVTSGQWLSSWGDDLEKLAWRVEAYMGLEREHEELLRKIWDGDTLDVLVPPSTGLGLL